MIHHLRLRRACAALARHCSRATLAACLLAPLLPAAPPAAPRNLTFFVVSDTHYGLSREGDRTVPKLVDLMNELPGTAYPAEFGGAVAEPRGVLHIGDMTNDGKREQWEMFVRDYGLTGKDGRLKWPVYEAYGNHDGGPKTPVRDGIRARNPNRVGLTAISDNGLHYSWDWDGIHFINLGIIHGHAHQPFIYLWNDIDIYHPPHFRQKDPKQGGPVSHGIFVFRITGNELSVVERTLDGKWGMSSRKNIASPAKR